MVFDPNEARSPFGTTPGGGKALPPYLQLRDPSGQPAITPYSQVVPGEAGNKPTAASPYQASYDAAKAELGYQRDTAKSNAINDASKRGVYYGSPLTTSQGDIDSAYLRSLASLQAETQKQQQTDQLSRLQAAAGLLGGQGYAQGGTIDPSIFSALAAMFQSGNSPVNYGK